MSPIPENRPATYAVLFRTHVWDDFVERQYGRLVERVGRGHVFILLDETNGSVTLPGDARRVVRHTTASIMALGLAAGGSGNMLWYNGDYPLYYFQASQPYYDYYMMVEYDVTLNAQVDELVDRAARERADLVSLSKGEPVSEWPHRDSCLAVYGAAGTHKRLICLSLFSSRAVCALFETRRELSRDLSDGKLDSWPYCEGFIPSELMKRGFKLLELSEFGSTEHYDWWPPVLEDDLDDLRDHAFVHPVLDQRRFVDASLRIWKLGDVFDRQSALMQRLRRVPLNVYGGPLAASVRKRVGGAVRRRLSQVG